ncbi:MAG: glycosyltransferase involved in cell wall biosynthesis [Halieaceae bacterium]|jgi:glycosyltransferase involved in cell wall biosynthesis
MRVSACLIVRDEELFLADCLSRLRPFADEIIVVDTGSLDKSVEIATAYGALIIHRKWHNDFSAARNAGLDQATGDWILYIDADEQLQASAAHKQCLEAPGLIAASVKLRAAQHLLPYRELRLFRNRPDIRFVSAIHETVRPAIMAIAERENKDIIHTAAKIEHFGYEGDLTHKHVRNRDMLLAAIAATPERIYLWHALGECELGLGNATQAEAAWREALARVRSAPSSPTNALIYCDLLAFHYTDTTAALADITELEAEASQHHSEDPLVAWYLARGHLVRGNTNSARALLQPLVAKRSGEPNDSVLGYDQRLFGEYAWALLGSCAIADEDYPEAREYFRKALVASPDSNELRTKLALAEARCRALKIGTKANS